MAATKKIKGAMLDEFCIVTGLSRERARHLLTATGTRPSNVVKIDRRRAKSRKYSTDAARVLERVWVLSGCEYGPRHKRNHPTDEAEAHGSLGHEQPCRKVEDCEHRMDEEVAAPEVLVSWSFGSKYVQGGGGSIVPAGRLGWAGGASARPSGGSRFA